MSWSPVCRLLIACLAIPSRTLPSHAWPNLACLAPPRRASPGHALPRPACLALPGPAPPCRCRALPRLAMPALPRFALPGLATPCLPSPAVPGRASPCLATPLRALPAMPRLAPPRLTLPRHALAALPCLWSLCGVAPQVLKHHRRELLTARRLRLESLPVLGEPPEPRRAQDVGGHDLLDGHVAPHRVLDVDLLQ